MSNFEIPPQAADEAKYGQLAERFAKEEFDPENNAEHRELMAVGKNMVDCFDWQPAKEGFLVVTDTKVMAENPMLLKAVEAELKGRIAAMKDPKKGSYKLLVTEASPKSATPFGEEIGEAMRDKPVMILTSMSRSHSKETGVASRGDTRLGEEEIKQMASSDELKELSKKGFSGLTLEKLSELQEDVPDEVLEKLKELAKSRRSRVMSVTKAHNPYDILTKGAVFETVENLRERADKVNEMMKDVCRVHITTDLGTDLWLTINPKYNEIEDGRLDKPGKLSNYPIGEWSTSPEWEGSEGVMVVDGPTGGNINQHLVDKGEPLKLTIKNGEVINVDGGQEALKLWKAYLDSGNNDHNDAYRLAELGIGTNSRALEGKPREYWGSSEGEKVYGTCHVAVGSNGTFGRTPDDPNYNAASVHCDMVLGLNPGGEVTVECERQDGSKFILIEKNQTKGY